MSERLPPPLVINRAAHDAQTGPLRLLPGTNDVDVARAFGAVLVEARATRGLSPSEIALLVPDDPFRPVAGREGDDVWLPHLFSVDTPSEPMIAWELTSRTLASEILGPSASDAERWGRCPAQLVRLLELAAREREPAEGHLSLRWLLAHQEFAARLLTEGQVEIDHVSLHVAADEEDMLVDALVAALGMVEIPRPPSISVPGRWLQTGSSRLHLNSRNPRPDEPGFPGTAPNHLCLRVADLDACERELERTGLETRRAGSLGQQLWVRLASGTAIELQPLHRDH